MEEEKKKDELIIKAFIDDKEIDLSTIKITIEFEGNKAETDVKTSIVRNMTLLQENIIFRMALEEIREKMGMAPPKTTEGGIIIPE